MERRLKEDLKMYFEAPAPRRKERFLRQFDTQKISLFPLAFMQIKYISKWVWLVSVVFCGITYAALDVLEAEHVSFITAWIPFMVMLFVTESMRSYRYGMDELETSARFSLKSIVMARMLILGIASMIFLIVFMQIISVKSELHVLHIFTPYFFTASGGFYIVRYIRGVESTVLCFSLASFISVVQIVLQLQYEEWYLPDYLPIWAIICTIGILGTIKQSYRTIRMTEELAWN